MLLSALMLFVELALIRWTGTNVVYLSYFSNFILLGAFLGVGLGFLLAPARRDLFAWAPVTLASLVLFVQLFPVEINRSGSELLYFGSIRPTGLPIWVTLPIVFAASAAVMAMIGQGVARTFDRFEPLEAYRLDILGSIAGIIAFSVLSFLHAPPVAWGILAAATFLILLGPSVEAPQLAAVIVLVALLGLETMQPNTTWSPYYKISMERLSTAPTPARVDVNGAPHQAIESIELRRWLEPIYFLPYQRAAFDPEQVLVVGAGNGTDVAIALAHGATHVDAVEIDPRLYEMGKDLHPDRPYDDPRVAVHIDDGRAFMERTRRRYDLIVFALPDSLTLVAGQSSLRLESYLFTLEAMQEARDHLAPDGVFAMYNYYREQWLIDRLARTLQTVYGRPPCMDTVGGSGRLALLTASTDPWSLSCPELWRPAADAPAAATDDYPFVYLRGRTVPGFYLLTIALILAASVLAVRWVAGPLGSLRRYLDLFFMGSAFLLLETMNVVRFALLFGTTWFVNALVFTGILASVYLAVEVAKRVWFRRPARLYGWLAAALAIAFSVPHHALLALSPGPRFVAATALAFTPIFLANLVFAQRFQHTGASTVAFGANLLGAMVGGVLEYASLVVGYRALLVGAGMLYAAAFVTGRRHLAATTVPA